MRQRGDRAFSAVGAIAVTAAALGAGVLAVAYGAPSWLLDSRLTFALAGLVSGVALVGLYLRFHGQSVLADERLAAAKSLTAHLTRERETLQAVHAALPDGIIAWTRNGEIVSPGMAHRLHLTSTVESFTDVAPAFAPAAFKRLAQAVEALCSDNIDFRMELEANVGGYTFEAQGRARNDVATVTFREITAERTTRRQDHAQLGRIAAERDWYKSLLNAVGLPLWWRRGDLALAGCNQAYAKMVESTPEAVVAGGVELASAVDAGLPKRLAAQARDQGAPASENRRIVVGGDRRVFAMTEVPVGKGGEVVGFGREVSGEEEARSELARHVAAHAEVLQNLSAALVIYGADKRLILSNHAFARLWQLDEAWLASKPHFPDVLERLRELRRVPEQADWQPYKAAQLALFKSPEPGEELLHLPDGRTIRARTSPHPLGGLVIVYEDVTNQLVLERARNTLIDVQRATLDNLYEAVVVFGSDGCVSLYNAAYGRLWQLGDDVLAVKPHIRDVIDACRPLLESGDDWPKVQAKLLQPFFERRADSGRLERADGSVVDYATVPLPDGAMLHTYLDVTDTTRIERALLDRNEALRAADHLKSEFVANVSYELRTPLTTIMGFTEILANQYFGELNRPQAEYTQGILAESHRLLILVSDIIDLASIEVGQLALELGEFDLAAMLDNLAGLVREWARRQSLALHVDCPKTIGRIVADERRVKQVMLKLVNNALKFTPQGGTIWIGARREGGQVAMWVKDTGVGIPESDRPQIFDRFWRGNNQAGQRGAGLGLSLVRSIVELHGGRVELESSREHGTTVTCWLPEQAAEVKPVARVAQQ